MACKIQTVFRDDADVSSEVQEHLVYIKYPHPYTPPTQHNLQNVLPCLHHHITIPNKPAYPTHHPIMPNY